MLPERGGIFRAWLLNVIAINLLVWPAFMAGFYQTQAQKFEFQITADSFCQLATQ